MLILIGIKQGDSLPILFNVIMSEIIKKIKSADRKCRMENRKIEIVCDDTVIISKNKDNL